MLGEHLDIKYAEELYKDIFDSVVDRARSENLNDLQKIIYEELDGLVIRRHESKKIVNGLDYDIFSEQNDDLGVAKSWEQGAYNALHYLCLHKFDIVKDVNVDIEMHNKRKESKEFLINERLEARGFGERQQDNEHLAIESVKEYFNFEFVNVWGDADYYVYNEQTADGYDLIVTTHDVDNINISEDVHYYDNDVTDLVVNEITNSIYSEPETFKIYMCDMDFADCMSGIYEELFMDAAQRLTDEIIKKLKKDKLIK